jgi:hypothetical protein
MQKTTENLILLAFVMPGLVLPGDEGVMTPKMTDNIVTILSLGLLSTREKGVRKTKDDRKPYSWHSLCRGSSLPGDKGGDDPEDDRQPCYLYIFSLVLVSTREKELAIQKTTENLIILTFIMPGLVFTRRRRR